MSSPQRDQLAVILQESFQGCRKDGMSVAASFDLLADVFRQQILDKIGVTEAEGLVKDDHVMVQSIVGGGSGQPAVQFRVGFEQWQMDVTQAREHAQTVMMCAEAAVHDAAMFRWLALGPIGMDREAAMQAIVELRRFRGDVDREDWRLPDD